ncbi:MAG: tripartite tricarboxylate transporter permease, partial [Planctomycetota bacterium]
MSGHRVSVQGRALALGVMASTVGGLVSWLFLVILTQPIARLSAGFGNFEFFALVVLALVMIASLGGTNVMRSLLAGAIGVLLAMPGINAATGQTRLTAGITELNDGFKLLPVLIGLFAISQILREIACAIHGQTSTKQNPVVRLGNDSVRFGIADMARHAVNMLRSSVIGTLIGILPGIGANISSVAAYAAAKGLSKEPDAFGRGSESGVVAAESANNATIGGALIPLLAMGLPGSVVEAVLLGALVLHGLQPGPRLMQEAPAMVYTVMGSMLIANLMMTLIMLGTMRWMARLTSVPRAYLLPVILMFCVIGSFAMGNRFFDVWVMLGFGVLGLVCESRWVRLPLAPLIIGFVLGPIAETKISQGLQASGGSWWPLLTRPI